ncbi:MAG: hypothetical protein HN368_12465 [Spirochaetales bacterium]|nr:hypothetical protein [Spirochaetales bacterium]
MKNELEYLVWLTESEFRDNYFNGASMLETLQAFTVGEAISSKSFEKYSAWGIALHVMFWKFDSARKMGLEDSTLYPYQEADWPALPASLIAESWQQTIDTLVSVHEVYLGLIKKLPELQLSAEMPGYNRSWGKVLFGIATHDTFHTAQMRSMGVKHFNREQT